MAEGEPVLVKLASSQLCSSAASVHPPANRLHQSACFPAHPDPHAHCEGLSLRCQRHLQAF